MVYKTLENYDDFTKSTPAPHRITTPGYHGGGTPAHSNSACTSSAVGTVHANVSVSLFGEDTRTCRFDEQLIDRTRADGGLHEGWPIWPLAVSGHRVEGGVPANACVYSDAGGSPRALVNYDQVWTPTVGLHGFDSRISEGASFCPGGPVSWNDGQYHCGLSRCDPTRPHLPGPAPTPTPVKPSISNTTWNSVFSYSTTPSSITSNLSPVIASTRTLTLIPVQWQWEAKANVLPGFKPTPVDENVAFYEVPYKFGLFNLSDLSRYRSATSAPSSTSSPLITSGLMVPLHDAAGNTFLPSLKTVMRNLESTTTGIANMESTTDGISELAAVTTPPVQPVRNGDLCWDNKFWKGLPWTASAGSITFPNGKTCNDWCGYFNEPNDNWYSTLYGNVTRPGSAVWDKLSKKCAVKAPARAAIPGHAGVPHDPTGHFPGIPGTPGTPATTQEPRRGVTGQLCVYKPTNHMGQQRYICREANSGADIINHNIQAGTLSAITLAGSAFASDAANSVRIQLTLNSIDANGHLVKGNVNFARWVFDPTEAQARNPAWGKINVAMTEWTDAAGESKAIRNAKETVWRDLVKKWSTLRNGRLNVRLFLNADPLNPSLNPTRIGGHDIEIEIYKGVRSSVTGEVGDANPPPESSTRNPLRRFTMQEAEEWTEARSVNGPRGVPKIIRLWQQAIEKIEAGTRMRKAAEASFEEFKKLYKVHGGVRAQGLTRASLSVATRMAMGTVLRAGAFGTAAATSSTLLALTTFGIMLSIPFV